MKKRPTTSARPRIVLLPGMDGTELLLTPLASRLAELGADPLIVTYPEAGPNRYGELLPKLAQQVESAGECILVGWSFSGPLALRAARSCNNVRGVILAASFVEPPRPLLRRLRTFVRTPIVATLGAARLLTARLLGPPKDPFRRATVEVLRRVPPSTLAVRSRAILAVDAGKDLQQCPVPVHYLASSQDRIVTRRSLTRILELRPDVTWSTIAGGHFALSYDASAGSNAIIEFVDSLAAAVPRPAPKT
ncbi:MAG: alpha/beta hydrolase [bacterium]|nr:alpha/beta hydrolase [bacterium]